MSAHATTPHPRAASMAGRGGDRADGRSRLPFAWAGWVVEVPEDWRPMKIEGRWDRGLVILGDVHAPRMQIKWWRPARKLDAPAWLDRQQRRWARSTRTPASHTALPGEQQLRQAGFEHMRWLPNAHHRGQTRAMWYGIATAPAHAADHDQTLVLEVVLDPVATPAQQRHLARQVLATLCQATREGTTLWAAYDVGFEVPVDYRLVEHRLHLGDFIMRFAHRDGSQLTLRQVFPAGLALSRRSSGWWMKTWPFKTLRPFHPATDEMPCVIEAPGRMLEGVQQRGTRRIPFPLGWLRPLRTLRIAVTDDALDRLLIAQWDVPGQPEPQPPVLHAVLLGMNRAMRMREATA